jgi:hypothetical protein
MGTLELNGKSIVEKVFQWRLLDTDVASREEHKGLFRPLV